MKCTVIMRNDFPTAVVLAHYDGTPDGPIVEEAVEHVKKQLRDEGCWVAGDPELKGVGLRRPVYIHAHVVECWE